jgi:hypothetical protein
MSVVLRVSNPSWSGRHDIGGGVDAPPGLHRAVKNAIVPLGFELGGGQGPQGTCQEFPRLNLIEQLEPECPEEDFLGMLAAIVNDVPDKVLADPIRGPVGVGEAMPLKDEVVTPGGRRAVQTAEENVLSLDSKPPVGVKDCGRLEASDSFKRNGSWGRVRRMCFTRQVELQLQFWLTGSARRRGLEKSCYRLGHLRYNHVWSVIVRDYIDPACSSLAPSEATVLGGESLPVRAILFQPPGAGSIDKEHD